MEIVGNFQFNRADIIGQGASGIVFKGTSALNPKQTVAVKAVKKKPGKQAELLSKEIQILKGLTDVKHENIVALFDCKVLPQHVYLIMEYCNGGNLEEYLQPRRMLPESTIAHFLRQIASAMKLFTTLGIVHRDLKPQNMLLCHTGHVCNNPSEITLKIADFGFARFLEDGIMAATLCGSPLYMAPEVFMCQPYDAQADLWSVATIVYQCLTGAAPFLAQTPQMLRHFYEQTPVLNPSIPRSTSKELKNLLMGILKRNPRDRMTFDTLFNHPFLTGDLVSQQALPKTTDDADEVFRGLSHSIQVKNEYRAVSPVRRRRRTISSPSLSSRPLSPCLDDYVIIPDVAEDSPDDDSKSSGTATPTNSLCMASQQSGTNTPRESFKLPRSSSQPMSVPNRRGSLPSYRTGSSASSHPGDSSLPRLERHCSQPVLIPASYGSPRTRTNAPRSSFATLPALDEIRPQTEFSDSPPQSIRQQELQWHGSARPCQPTLLHRKLGSLRNLTPSPLLATSPTSPTIKENFQRSPSYTSIPAIESMSPPSVQFVIGSSSPPSNLDLEHLMARRQSPSSPTLYHFGSQGIAVHQCRTEPMLLETNIPRLRSQFSSSYGRSVGSLSSSPLTRYFSSENVNDVFQLKRGEIEGPIVFVVPELSNKTLLNEEHNAILEKLEFISRLARVIADVASERSSPLAESLFIGNPGVGSASPNARIVCWQPLQFEDESQRWAEQLVLYVRALQLLASALQLSRCALRDGRLERVNSVKNAVLELHTNYQDCLAKLKVLKAQAARYQTVQASTRMVTADELMYSAALEMGLDVLLPKSLKNHTELFDCKLGAMDEHLGNIEQCVQRYHDAHILLHGLSRYAYVSEDRTELDRYKTGVERRLRILHNLGFVQITR